MKRVPLDRKPQTDPNWPAVPADNPARVRLWVLAVSRYMRRQGRSEADIVALLAHYGVQ